MTSVTSIAAIGWTRLSARSTLRAKAVTARDLERNSPNKGTVRSGIVPSVTVRRRCLTGFLGPGTVRECEVCPAGTILAASVHGSCWKIAGSHGPKPWSV